MKSSSGYEIYHNTLSACLDEIESYVTSKGYTLGDYFPLINHISYGSTERTQLEMLKDGRIANTLAIQIYRLDSGKYELNCYPVRKFALGGGIESEYMYKEVFDYFIGGDRPSSLTTLKKQVDAKAKKLNLSVSQIYEGMEEDRASSEDYHYFVKGGGVDEPEIKVGQVYLNTSSNTEFIISKIEKNATFDEMVEYHTNNEEPRYYNTTHDRLSLMENLIDNGTFVLVKNKYAKGGYTRPSYKIITTGFFSFKTKDKEYYVRSGLFERQNDTEDSLQIQDELRGELGSIIIQNSAWKRLSDGKTIKARSSKGNLMGTLTRVAMINDSFQPNKPKEIVPYSVGDRFKYNFDNKTYEVIGIGYNNVRLQNVNGKWSDNREVTLSLMNKWILQKMMVKL
jgi:hypothetical protein